MCLMALALGQHPRFPVVLAANRDEFFERPAAALDWWQAAPDAPPLLAGRDLRAGGTWLGLSAQGRLAGLTNVRRLPFPSAAAPSRGALVPAWLSSQAEPELFERQHRPVNYSLFNLLVGDLARNHWAYLSSEHAGARTLGPGLYGLSNAALDTPWPKTLALKSALAQALAAQTHPAAPVDELLEPLWKALRSDQPAADADLPDTGIGLERERWLSSAFIPNEGRVYGTRCSTLVVLEQGPGGERHTQVWERSYDPDGHTLGTRCAELAGWPQANPSAWPHTRLRTIST